MATGNEIVAASSAEQPASRTSSDDSDVVITHGVSHPESESVEPLLPERARKKKKKIGEDDEEVEEEEEYVVPIKGASQPVPKKVTIVTQKE